MSAPLPKTLLETPAQTVSIPAILRASIVAFVLLTILTGLIYPLAITLVAKVAFAHQAEGSLIDKTGAPAKAGSDAVGSSLIGQTFDQPQYFWSRPSATSPMPYNAAASSGSNVGPSAIAPIVQPRVDALHQADAGNTAPIPVDLVTASASGLDPQESIAAAQYQIPRIAKIRHIAPEALQKLIDQSTDAPSLGLFGETSVNVLRLNLALDAAAPFTPTSTSSAPSATVPK